MEFLQLLFIAVYLGTPLLIVYTWFRLAALRPRRAFWPMPVALGQGTFASVRQVDEGRVTKQRLMALLAALVP